MKLLVHPAALTDFNDAVAFYTERADKQLGLALIAEFERALNLLADNPEMGATWRSSTRRLVLRRFPYSLIYQIHAQELRVIALAHQRRLPDFWKGRA